MLTGRDIVAIVNSVNVKYSFPIIKPELVDGRTSHEVVEVRCTEVASREHGGSG